VKLREFFRRGQAAQKAVDGEIKRHRRSHVINRDYCRRWALDYAATRRHHNFKRVSEQWLDQLEARVKHWMADSIKRLPSRGKTIR
jgi:hypothetical protein